MPLATDLPTDKIPGGPNHATGHNTTNTRVNDIATEVNTLSARQPARSLAEFRAGTDPDWTNAFAAASTWSTTNRRPIYVPESSTAYLVAAPIVLDHDAQFFSTHLPAWSPEANGVVPRTVISPTTGFPTSTNRGLFEFVSSTTTGRSTGLRGLALRGNGYGTSVHGIVLPGITDIPELGFTLADLEVSSFTGDGIRGGARVTFLDKVFCHENRGWGINMNLPWNDSRMKWIYCFYNKLGGLNVDLPGSGQGSQQLTIAQSRFERSGQAPYDGLNTGHVLYNATAPGIRMRAGAEISLVQVDTDANNGPGLDIGTDSATPTERPRNIYLSNVRSVRDGQGGTNTPSTSSVGIKIRGFSTANTAVVQGIHLTDCSVTYGAMADDGSTTALNPARALWIENTEFVDVSGGSYEGNVAPYYFGGAADPVNGGNWQLYMRIPQENISMLPNHWVDTPFHSVGMTRYNVETTNIEKWNGTAWEPTGVKYVTNLTDAATVTTDAKYGPYFRLTAAGNRTLAAPTNPTDAQTCTWEVVASGGARTLTLATGSAGAFAFGTTVTGLTATSSGLRDLITATYSAAADRWLVRTVEKGF